MKPIVVVFIYAVIALEVFLAAWSIAAGDYRLAAHQGVLAFLLIVLATIKRS